ncbi:MATE family efflux transporter [Pigmentiphaga aceris]|uniref:MATE family efflux transporter n=1 Tax=Pigmentiphaga aceris TaxID=1940612 RepID=A0A5C0AW83_9BURK|nr:MATE family efflux transporter [Pigmentiphaga aceris]QEI06568.1 MATE family efflux transporter [Pigmentiphaga aceris]
MSQSETKTLLSISAGVSMAIAASIGISFIETLVVAQLGAQALAGVTIALALYSLVFVGCLGVVVAINPILSQAVGRGDKAAIRSNAQQAGFVALAMSCVGLLVFAASPYLLALTASDPQQLDKAVTYLKGAAVGLPAWVFYIALRSVLMSLGSVRIATWTMLASVPFHALLAYALTHGTPLSPALGVLGAGIAHSAISYLTVVVILLAMRRSRSPAVRNVMQGPIRFDAPVFGAIFHLGAPMCARILLREGMLPASVMLVAPAGASMVAAHAVALRVVGFAGIVSFGLGSATIVQVGAAIGAKDWTRAKAISGLATRLCIGIGALVCVGIVLGATSIVGLFLPADDTITPMTARLLAVACLFVLIDCVQGPVGAALVAMQDARMPLVIYAVCVWLLGFPLAYVFSHGMSVAAEGVWLGLSVGSACATAMLVLRLRKKFRSQSIRPKDN